MSCFAPSRGRAVVLTLIALSLLLHPVAHAIGSAKALAVSQSSGEKDEGRAAHNPCDLCKVRADSLPTGADLVFHLSDISDPAISAGEPFFHSEPAVIHVGRAPPRSQA